MTGAERQAALRRRQRDAELAAYGHPQSQPTDAILRALARLLAQLDDPGRLRERGTLRSMAEQAVRELCTRHGLKPFSSR
jgi:hypothetical protein